MIGKGKVKEVFKFTMFWIDGQWKDVKDAELEIQGVSEGTVERFNGIELYHPLPFASGSRLKFQLPFMEEPVYGTLESELDGNDCWYHFLYCKEEKDYLSSIMLTGTEINYVSGYSSLEWIERA